MSNIFKNVWYFDSFDTSGVASSRSILTTTCKKKQLKNITMLIKEYRFDVSVSISYLLATLSHSLHHPAKPAVAQCLVKPDKQNNFLLLSKANLTVFSLKRRKIRLIESNAKFRHLTSLTCKGTLRQVFICLRPRTPYPPPLTHCIHVYSILIHTGRGGGGELKKPVRREEYSH